MIDLSKIQPVEGIEPAEESQDMQDLRAAIRILAKTSNSTAGYHAIHEAAWAIVRAECGHLPDSPATWCGIDQRVALLLREYEEKRGMVPPAILRRGPA